LKLSFSISLKSETEISRNPHFTIVLFLNIHSDLKIPFFYLVTFSIRDVYFQLQTRSVEFKGGFPRYFCTKLQRPASLPRLSFTNHSLFQLLSPRCLISFFLSIFLSVYLAFLFRLSLCVRPCNATTLPISSSRDLLLRPLLGPITRCNRDCTVKVAIVRFGGIPPFVNFLNRFDY